MYFLGVSGIYSPLSLAAMFLIVFFFAGVSGVRIGGVAFDVVFVHSLSGVSGKRNVPGGGGGCLVIFVGGFFFLFLLAVDTCK